MPYIAIYHHAKVQKHLMKGFLENGHKLLFLTLDSLDPQIKIFLNNSNLATFFYFIDPKLHAKLKKLMTV